MRTAHEHTKEPRNMEYFNYFIPFGRCVIKLSRNSHSLVTRRTHYTTYVHQQHSNSGSSSSSSRSGMNVVANTRNTIMKSNEMEFNFVCPYESVCTLHTPYSISIFVLVLVYTFYTKLDWLRITN